jgi:CDP-diacylglycerol--serine O-phosphatidyltransferase
MNTLAWHGESSLRHRRDRWLHLGRRSLPLVLVPNAITAAALLCGFVSIMQTMQSRFIPAAWCILAATVLDALDGRLAKALHATTPTGAVFDTLSDLTAFGLAPAALLYTAHLAIWGPAGLALCSLGVLAAAVRLARYTAGATGTDRPYFAGLPTTAAAALLGGYVVFSHALNGGYGSCAVAALIGTTAALMVSRIPYETDAVARPTAVTRHWKGRLVLVVVVTTLAFPAIGFFAWALFYCLAGAIRWLWRLSSRDGRVRTTAVLPGRRVA